MAYLRPLICAACFLPGMVAAQVFDIGSEDIKNHANDLLALMAFSVVPDLTSSFLSVSTESNEKNSLYMTQFAGGATVSTSLPLYLEGGLAYIRYDPTFIASNGAETRPIPAKWNTLATNGGVGWDFPIAEHWVLRPIFNFSLGQVASDVSVGARYLEWRTNKSLDFLDRGKLNAYGLGGSLMLDYELKRPDGEIDFEWRYTNIYLRTFDNTADSVKGEASAEATSLYARYRAPTGWTALDRPLRYVLEGAHTTYLGDQRGLLGINYMSSVGLGLELDSSAYDVFVTRTRLVARYAFGQNVSGFALGGGCELAMMCDFIIAADTARFGLPEVNLGIIPGIGGTQRLTRAVGKAKAMEMQLTGRFMDAAEAERSGLVARVVPARDLMTEARATAAKIAEKSQIAVIAAKDAVNRAFETTLAEGIRYERRAFQSLFATADQKEGMAAFLEKREAQFRDK